MHVHACGTNSGHVSAWVISRKVAVLNNDSVMMCDLNARMQYSLHCRNLYVRQLFALAYCLEILSLLGALYFPVATYLMHTAVLHLAYHTLSLLAIRAILYGNI